jgi:dienelactone hydrolase
VTAVAVALAALLAAAPPLGQEARRREELARLQRQLPKSDAFDKWLAESGALPPLLDRLPAAPFLQDPLRGQGGQTVGRAGWPARRREIAGLVERWLLGRAPPPPGNVSGTVTEKTKDQKGREEWRIELRFGPKRAALLRCAFVFPAERPKRMPVFLTDNRRHLAWVEGAMARGFAFVHCNARDPAYGPDDSEKYPEIFDRRHDWSAVMRRGWSMSRVVDWLVRQPFVDRRRIFVGGHSRSARQSLAAAAFDQRIAGVIASGPGTGASMPFRYADESMLAESAELLTRRFPDWVRREVRFWSGREHRLPADSHFLYTLMAPRPVLMSTSTEDWNESTWTVEQVFASARRVYDLLGKPHNLALRYRPGQRATDEEAHKAFSAFLLSAAGIDPKSPADLFPFRPYHPWDYEAWLAEHGQVAAPPPESPLEARIAWLLGEGPAYKPRPVALDKGESDAVAKLLMRQVVKARRRERLRFGEGVNGTLFLPDLAEGERAPCVIWLGPLHTSTGFLSPYYRSGELPPTAFVAAGFATLSFDPIGTGGRKEERRGFYQKHPRWSLLGKMVLDARHAIDAARASPHVDPERIFLVGYALGGQVALMAGGLDKRARAVAAVAGFTPFAKDSPRRPTGGLQRWSHVFGTLPRLGAFVGDPSRVPVDFPEILAAQAPRPLLVLAPRDDRHASHVDVIEAVQSARAAYERAGARDALVLHAPDDWNRLTDPMLAQVVSFLKTAAPTPLPPPPPRRRRTAPNDGPARATPVAPSAPAPSSSPSPSPSSSPSPSAAPSNP